MHEYHKGPHSGWGLYCRQGLILARVERDAFCVNHTAAEVYLGGDQIALEGIQVQTFLAADCEHRHESFDEIVCIFRITKHVFDADEQVQVREQYVHSGLEV